MKTSTAKRTQKNKDSMLWHSNVTEAKLHVLFILGHVVFRSGFGAVELLCPGWAKLAFLKGLLVLNVIAADLGGQLLQL